MRRTVCLLAVLVPLVAAADDMTVTLRDTSSLQLRSCSDARDEARFTTEGDDAARFVRSATRGDGTPLTRDGNAFSARGWQAGDCATFVIDARAIAARRDEDLGYALDGDVLLSPHAFLWRAGRGAATIAFALAPGIEATPPWRPLDEVPHRRYAISDAPRGWPALVAIGSTHAQELAAGTGALRIALPGIADDAAAATITRFARETARDVASVFAGAFALKPQLLVVSTRRSGSAVTFGQTLRGGGSGVVLYLDPARRLDEYHGDWTLAHELVHLVHPYLGDDGRWIGEGVATYYQNVVRARAGRMTPRAAWRALDAGFARGRANPSTLTLRETSRRMDRGLYMRAYWSGTAIALAGDVALRTRAEPVSLDRAIAGALDCCRERGRRDARVWLATLDEQVGGDALASAYDAVVDASAFPDVAAAYRALGLERRDGQLAFSDAPAAVALRTAIMGGDR